MQRHKSPVCRSLHKAVLFTSCPALINQCVTICLWCFVASASCGVLLLSAKYYACGEAWVQETGVHWADRHTCVIEPMVRHGTCSKLLWICMKLTFWGPRSLLIRSIKDVWIIYRLNELCALAEQAEQAEQKIWSQTDSCKSWDYRRCRTPAKQRALRQHVTVRISMTRKEQKATSINWTKIGD